MHGDKSQGEWAAHRKINVKESKEELRQLCFVARFIWHVCDEICSEQTLYLG